MGLEEIRYWLEDLQLRKKLEENQSMVLIGLICLIVISLSLIVCQLTGGGANNYSSTVKLVYFDLGNQAIRVVDHEYPAIPASPLKGTTDVYLASVFACEDCPQGQIKDGMSLDDLKANGMFIGWLERYDPEATEEMMVFGQSSSFRTIESDRWYNPTEKGYEAINQRLYARCPQPQICLP